MTFTADGRIQKLLERLDDPDLTELMARIEAIITEDHTRAILQGIDKDGISFKPVTYRGDRVARRVGRNQANVGIGLPLTTAAGNLTSAEYRKLTGPPLAPRGMASRIIANFYTESGWNGLYWFARGKLAGIVSRKGIPFMHFHFDGSGRLPRRDDRGVRPWGRAEILKETRRTLKQLLAGQ